MHAPFCGCRSRKYLEWSFLGEPLCGDLRSRGGVRGVDGDFTAAAASASATGRRLPPGELPVVHGLRPSCDPLFFFPGDDAIFAGSAGPDRAESPCFAAEVEPAACLTFRGDLCCFPCDCTTRSSAPKSAGTRPRRIAPLPRVADRKEWQGKTMARAVSDARVLPAWSQPQVALAGLAPNQSTVSPREQPRQPLCFSKPPASAPPSSLCLGWSASLSSRPVPRQQIPREKLGLSPSLYPFYNF
jgi:hypothetical protein